jgi:hypothetical protein
MKTEMAKGDIVKYANPTREEEKSCRFVLLDDPADGDMVDIQLIRVGLAFPPINRVHISEICPASRYIECACCGNGYGVGTTIPEEQGKAIEANSEAFAEMVELCKKLATSRNAYADEAKAILAKLTP